MGEKEEENGREKGKGEEGDKGSSNIFVDSVLPWDVFKFKVNLEESILGRGIHCPS